MNKQIYREACEWLVTFRTGSADANDRERLDTWLKRSPEHVRAYLEVTAIWENSAFADRERRVPDMEQLARASAEENVVPFAENVVPLEARSTFVRESRSTAAPRPRKWQWGLATAAVVTLCAVGIAAWVIAHRGTYATDIGEQRSVTLADGSVIDLNAKSRIRVLYSASDRIVRLEEGQALFHVARDSARPFIVYSDRTAVRAVGTAFDVYRKASGTVVTVVEGRVALLTVPARTSMMPPTAPAPEETASSGLYLQAGEQLTVTPKAIHRTNNPDVMAATAWTQHRMIFNSAPLRDVVEEFNRHNERRLVIVSPELESLGVVGVFSSTDPAPLLQFLRAQPRVDVVEEGDRIRIVQR